MAAPSPLGSFAKLPPEVRLCIWDYLVPMNEQRRPSDKDRVRKKGRRRLRIMRTSQALHDEISRYLYSNFQLKIRIKQSIPGGSAIGFEMDMLHARWIAADGENFLQWHFTNFPFHKVHITIHLSAPDPSDPGQLVLLSERLNRIIIFLGVRQPPKGISFVFDQTSDKWVKNQRQRDLLRDSSGSRSLYDHEVLALQLFRLQYYQGTARPRAEDPDEVLDWTNYNQVVSNILSQNANQSLDGWSGLTNSHYLEHTIFKIEEQLESRLTRRKRGSTANRIRSRRAWGRTLQKYDDERQETEWSWVKQTRKERERILKKVETWLTYLLPNDDEFDCGCNDAAHETKMVETTWQVPYTYRTPFWCEYDSDREADRRWHELYCRCRERNRHYICG